MMTAMKTVMVFVFPAHTKLVIPYGHADGSTWWNVSPCNNCGDTRERWPAIKSFL